MIYGVFINKIDILIQVQTHKIQVQTPQIQVQTPKIQVQTSKIHILDAVWQYIGIYRYM